MNVKSILDGIASDIEQHNSTVTTIMTEYREGGSSRQTGSRRL